MTSNAPVVRLVPVRDDELDELLEVFEAYCDEIEPHDPFAGPRTSEERSDAFLESREDEDWDWIEADGERVGFLMAIVYEDDPEPGDRTAEVTECYVAPSARRRGVARGAIERWLAREREAGTTLVEAGVLRDNEAARAFWAALGFAERSVHMTRRP